MNTRFLPVTREEMEERGIWQPDFVYITGDAYVDHPSFGAAIITRLLESQGFSVGVIAQPDWKKKESIAVFGEPRLAFLRFFWKYGLHGESLYSGEEAQKTGCLFSGEDAWGSGRTGR